MAYNVYFSKNFSTLSHVQSRHTNIRQQFELIYAKSESWISNKQKMETEEITIFNFIYVLQYLDLIEILSCFSKFDNSKSFLVYYFITESKLNDRCFYHLRVSNQKHFVRE